MVTSRLSAWFRNSSLQAQITPQLAQLREYLRKLSMREKAMVTVAAVAVLVTFANLIYTPIEEAFSEQTQRFTQVSQEIQNVSSALARYQRLRARHEEIEKEFREVEIEEGALTYLEELLKGKAGVLNPDIKPREVRDFGADYQQAPFSINFPIVDLSRLVQFLEALVAGEKPFILSSLNIRRRPAGDSLQVELEVSSIRKKQST